MAAGSFSSGGASELGPGPKKDGGPALGPPMVSAGTVEHPAIVHKHANQKMGSQLLNTNPRSLNNMRVFRMLLTDQYCELLQRRCSRDSTKLA